MTGPGNAVRAAWAALAIEAFQSAAGQHDGLDTAEAAANLITALCHYADRHGISFGEILTASSDAYLSQRASEQHAYKPGDEVRIRDGAVLAPSLATLPRLGTVKTHESTRKLARRIEAGTARILSATVSRTAQRWHVSFTVETERDIQAHHPRPGSAVGVDLGIKTLLTGAGDHGEVIAIDGPKPLKAALRKLRRAGREHARKQPGSCLTKCCCHQGCQLRLYRHHRRQLSHQQLSGAGRRRPGDRPDHGHADVRRRLGHDCRLADRPLVHVGVGLQ